MIALFGAAEGSNVILRLDDVALVEDEGEAMPTPYLLSLDVDFGRAGGMGRLRRITQALSIGAATTVRVTPIANGGEQTDQAESFALATVDGAEQRVEHMVASVGTRHAVKLEFVALEGAASLGECDLHLVPRRSTEHA